MKNEVKKGRCWGCSETKAVFIGRPVVEVFVHGINLVVLDGSGRFCSTKCFQSYVKEVLNRNTKEQA